MPDHGLGLVDWAATQCFSADVAEKTAMEWQEGVHDYAIAHFDEMKRRLDVLDPDYAN
ncbi:hypothetical protein [Mesorhizobium sp. M3A.F.Ca.ET.080.04.2.1]|uniref:hypothetical protein n=1 Tax=Mesorhizobium sp. M3A.F.Ca.ET.080.04.2.1 TaxID=2493676 RepID=UPI001FE04632|nr:hypothetical protein [Mesorhizobium sp. M3A.F.Ca.ET.080.04.2.1]